MRLTVESAGRLVSPLGRLLPLRVAFGYARCTPDGRFLTSGLDARCALLPLGHTLFPGLATATSQLRFLLDRCRGE